MDAGRALLVGGGSATADIITHRCRRPVADPAARVLFVCHESDADPGYLGEAAAARGFSTRSCALWDGEALPEPTAYDLIVSLGSAEAAYDDAVPWLAAELDLLRRAVDAQVAVLGVCFGAQALARALGGSVHRAEVHEVGWVTVDTSAPGLVEPGPWFEWHFDTLTPPPGAATLARSPAGVQAFTVGRVIGVQFHPEVTPEIVAAWTVSSGQRVRAVGVDPDRLVADTRAHAPRARAAAHRLFDRVVAHLGVST